jgi:hypothetical protein
MCISVYFWFHNAYLETMQTYCYLICRQLDMVAHITIFRQAVRAKELASMPIGAPETIRIRTDTDGASFSYSDALSLTSKKID